MLGGLELRRQTNGGIYRSPPSPLSLSPASSVFFSSSSGKIHRFPQSKFGDGVQWLPPFSASRLASRRCVVLHKFKNYLFRSRSRFRRDLWTSKDRRLAGNWRSDPALSFISGEHKSSSSKVERASEVFQQQNIYSWRYKSFDKLSGHPICTKRYHIIVKGDGTSGRLKYCSNCGSDVHLSDHRCKSCSNVTTSENAEDWMYQQLEDTSHLLHGVIHENGYGHLLRINGREGGSKLLSGFHLMDFWDRLCKYLGVSLLGGAILILGLYLLLWGKEEDQTAPVKSAESNFIYEDPLTVKQQAAKEEPMNSNECSCGV